MPEPPRTRARHLRHGHRLDGELRPRRNSGYAQLVTGESSHDLRMEASLKVLTSKPFMGQMTVSRKLLTNSAQRERQRMKEQARLKERTGTFERIER